MVLTNIPKKTYIWEQIKFLNHESDKRGSHRERNQANMARRKIG